MAGSRRWFAYFDDGGTEYAIELDESVAESISLSFGQSITPAVAADLGRQIRPTTKRPIEPRYVLASRQDADDRTVKRKFYVGATSAPVFGGSPYGVLIDGQTWNITARVGEKRYYVPAKDTGLIDGDVDDNIVVSGG